MKLLALTIKSLSQVTIENYLPWSIMKPKPFITRQVLDDSLNPQIQSTKYPNALIINIYTIIVSPTGTMAETIALSDPARPKQFILHQGSKWLTAKVGLASVGLALNRHAQICRTLNPLLGSFPFRVSSPRGGLCEGVGVKGHQLAGGQEDDVGEAEE